MVLAAIPARYAASRFPGKPAAMIGGRAMIAWVVEAASRAQTIDSVAVITDDERIARLAAAAGARAIVSERPTMSGTDRIGHLLELDRSAAAAETIVNLQADEPLIEPSTIDTTVRGLDDPSVDISTPVRLLRDGESADDPNLVKAVVGATGDGLYFSRAAVPYGHASLIHVGLYAYRRPALERFIAAGPTPIERGEKLEQLRAIELRLRIRCVLVDTRSIGVDTPEDLERVESLLRGAGDMAK